MRHTLHQSVCVFLWKITRWIQSFPLAPIHRSAWKGNSPKFALLEPLEPSPFWLEINHVSA